MKKLALAAAIVVSQALALSAFAQEAKRADVKADTASAVKAGAIPKGEASAKEMPTKSTKARPDVKKDTAAATKAGAIEKGEAKAPEMTEKPKSSKARADVKKETAEATKAGTIPKGEASK